MGGALAISELMPAQYKHTLAGPSLKVDPHTGALAEGVLTFVVTLAVLWVIVKGPRNAILRILLISVSIVSLIVAGAEYTGPSMNPANVSIFASPFMLISLCFFASIQCPRVVFRHHLLLTANFVTKNITLWHWSRP